jgi:hypothetical protein
MFKLVVLTKRKAGMSMEAFMDYYENNHAPLMTSFYPQVKKYTRTYLFPVSHETLTGDYEQPYDCVTEAYFEDEAGWLDVIRSMEENPERTAAHAADEENLFDRSKIGWFKTVYRETVNK